MRDLERGIHNITEVQQNRICALGDIAEQYLDDYRLRYRGITFAEYAIGHVVRLLGDKLVVDVDDAAVLQYQSDRLKEGAAPKSINEEVRFLLTLLGDSGELIRARLRKKKKLKLPARRKIGKAYEPEETHRMRDQSRGLSLSAYAAGSAASLVATDMKYSAARIYLADGESFSERQTSYIALLDFRAKRCSMHNAISLTMTTKPRADESARRLSQTLTAWSGTTWWRHCKLRGIGSLRWCASLRHFTSRLL